MGKEKVFVTVFIGTEVLVGQRRGSAGLGIKVTVQFETEGNGQIEIVSPMDRSEVKL